MLTCSECLTTKQTSEFHKNNSAKTGRFGTCKDCRNAAERARRALGRTAALPLVLDLVDGLTENERDALRRHLSPPDPVKLDPFAASVAAINNA